MTTSKQHIASLRALMEELLQLIQRAEKEGVSTTELYALLHVTDDKKAKKRVANAILRLKMERLIISKKRGLYVASSTLGTT